MRELSLWKITRGSHCSITEQLLQRLPVQYGYAAVGNGHDAGLLPCVEHFVDRDPVHAQDHGQILLGVGDACPGDTPVPVRVAGLGEEQAGDFLVPVIEGDPAQLLGQMVACIGQELEHDAHELLGAGHVSVQMVQIAGKQRHLGDGGHGHRTDTLG